VHKLTLSFKGKILKVYHLDDGETTIGRSPDCDITIDNLAVSPLHAIVTVNGFNAHLTDKSEDNNLLINSVKTSEKDLERGDIVLVGKHTLTYSRESQIQRETASPQPAPDTSQPNGWLQFMNGPKLGRTMRLDQATMRLGKAGKHGAIIKFMDGNYFISHLEGEQPTKVGAKEVGDEAIQLKDGDNIQIGGAKMLFFIE
jgi:predicted component of type VI protein secretion system